jgi:quinol monooxygenase YgiN
MSFVLVVRMMAQEGTEDEAAATMRELAEATRQEPDRRSRKPALVPLFEQYVDKAAFEAHGVSDRFQQLVLGKLFSLLESRERAFYETL